MNSNTTLTIRKDDQGSVMGSLINQTSMQVPREILIAREAIMNAIQAINRREIRDLKLNIESPDPWIACCPHPNAKIYPGKLAIFDNGIGISESDVTTIFSTLMTTGNYELDEFGNKVPLAKRGNHGLGSRLLMASYNMIYASVHKDEEGNRSGVLFGYEMQDGIPGFHLWTPEEINILDYARTFVTFDETNVDWFINTFIPFDEVREAGSGTALILNGMLHDPEGESCSWKISNVIDKCISVRDIPTTINTRFTDLGRFAVRTPVAIDSHLYERWNVLQGSNAILFNSPTEICSGSGTIEWKNMPLKFRWALDAPTGTTRTTRRDLFVDGAVVGVQFDGETYLSSQPTTDLRAMGIYSKMNQLAFMFDIESLPEDFKSNIRVDYSRGALFYFNPAAGDQFSISVDEIMTNAILELLQQDGGPDPSVAELYSEVFGSKVLSGDEDSNRQELERMMREYRNRMLSADMLVSDSEGQPAPGVPVAPTNNRRGPTSSGPSNPSRRRKSPTVIVPSSNTPSSGTNTWKGAVVPTYSWSDMGPETPIVQYEFNSKKCHLHFNRDSDVYKRTVTLVLDERKDLHMPLTEREKFTRALVEEQFYYRIGSYIIAMNELERRLHHQELTAESDKVKPPQLEVLLVPTLYSIKELGAKMTTFVSKKTHKN